MIALDTTIRSLKESGIIPYATHHALVTRGITTIHDLSTYTEEEISGFYGIGPYKLKRLKEVLAEANLSFRSPEVPRPESPPKDTVSLIDNAIEAVSAVIASGIENEDIRTAEELLIKAWQELSLEKNT